jgi:hypothetical protein
VASCRSGNTATVPRLLLPQERRGSACYPTRSTMTGSPFAYGPTIPPTFAGAWHAVRIVLIQVGVGLVIWVVWVAAVLFLYWLF